MSILIIKVAVLCCLLSGTAISLRAQASNDDWRRVYTGEDSIIDLNPASLIFEPERVLRVTLRTVLSQPERLNRTSETKYKSRIETVEFKTALNEYRYRQMIWLDSAGKTVWSDEPGPPPAWKPYKNGGMMYRLFEAVRELPPFGEWKVIDYRFGDGTPVDHSEFRKFIGARVSFDPQRAAVGAKVCSLPAYQSGPASDKDFSREMGISLQSLGIQTDHTRTVVVKCESNDWTPPRSLLVHLPEGGELLLWQGVFLVLKRGGVNSGGYPMPLKKVVPMVHVPNFRVRRVIKRAEKL